MGLAHIEDDEEPLAYVEMSRGRDAGNESPGVPNQVEIGFRTQRLSDFDRRFPAAFWRRAG